jgi:hypothetical protein
MDGATLQSLVYAGFAQAAKNIGTPYALYRPADPLAPIGTKIATLPADFRASNNYMAPNKYGVATWLGLYDASLVDVGDYFVGAAGTFFVAQQSAFRNLYVVGCNRTISVSRTTAPAGIGALPYNAMSTADPVFMAGWPASVLRGQPGEKNHVGLPGDERTPWFQILVPALAGVSIEYGDVITDDLVNRYVCSQIELTDLGWRILAQQAVT